MLDKLGFFKVYQTFLSVLPFGLSTACYVFVKVMPTHKPILYMDDGIGIAGIATLSEGAKQAASIVQSFATLPALVTVSSSASNSLLSSIPHQSTAMVLSSALPPVAAKLVAKIKSGQFVEELLADNTSLCHQLGPSKPRLREIDSPLTWVSCLLAYAAGLTTDEHTRSLLTYGRLVVREAQASQWPRLAGI